MRFEVIHEDKKTGARVGKLYTEHGVIDTPCFMPVGTKATVKGLSPEEVHATGAQILLSNTYHLYLRPGHELIEKAGGLHKFMNWDGAILTDSGGFQVFSLSSLRKITDDGAEFNSFIDGSKHFFSPEKSMEVQKALGSDIVMAFDECTPPDITHDKARDAMERTLKWLDRCSKVELKPHQTLFPIVQGNVFADLRKESAERTVPYAKCGIAIGGLSVGESAEKMYEMLDVLQPILPKDQPHYLMGVGTADYIVEGVARGVDMFDCVLPTRIARNGTAMVKEGFLTIRNADRVAVLYAGQIVELGTVDEVFYDPRHPYTWALLSSLPQLAEKNTELYSISGTPPSLYNKIIGDPFAPRNPYCLKVDTLKEAPMFQVSETHFAKTWLLDPRAPKIEKPEIIKDIHGRLLKAFNIEEVE